MYKVYLQHIYEVYLQYGRYSTYVLYDKVINKVTMKVTGVSSLLPRFVKTCKIFIASKYASCIRHEEEKAIDIKNQKNVTGIPLTVILFYDRVGHGLSFLRIKGLRKGTDVLK